MVHLVGKIIEKDLAGLYSEIKRKYLSRSYNLFLINAEVTEYKPILRNDIIDGREEAVNVMSFDIRMLIDCLV